MRTYCLVKYQFAVFCFVFLENLHPPPPTSKLPRSFAFPCAHPFSLTQTCFCSHLSGKLLRGHCDHLWLNPKVSLCPHLTGPFAAQNGGIHFLVLEALWLLGHTLVCLLPRWPLFGFICWFLFISLTLNIHAHPLNLFSSLSTLIPLVFLLQSHGFYIPQVRTLLSILPLQFKLPLPRP